MKKLPDSPKSSLQRLRPILAGALKDGFTSQLEDVKQAKRSEEIVNTIVLELETYLVDLTSETIDQVSGRLETRLNGLFGKKVSVTDKIVDFFKSVFTSKVTDEDRTLAEAVCQVLNGINKDDRLKDLREYLKGDSEKEGAPAGKKKGGKKGEEDEKSPMKGFSSVSEAVAFDIEKAIMRNMSKLLSLKLGFLEMGFGVVRRIDRLINRDIADAVENEQLEAANRKMIVETDQLFAERRSLMIDNFKLTVQNIVDAVFYVIGAAKFIVKAVILIFQSIVDLVQAVMVVIKCAIAIVKITISVITFIANILTSALSAFFTLLVLSVKVLFFAVVILLLGIVVSLALLLAAVIVTIPALLALVVFPIVAVVAAAIMLVAGVVLVALLTVMTLVQAVVITLMAVIAMIPIILFVAFIFGIAVYLDFNVVAYGWLVGIYMSAILFSAAALESVIFGFGALILAVMTAAVAVVTVMINTLTILMGVLTMFVGMIAVGLLMVVEGDLINKLLEWFGFTDDEEEIDLDKVKEMLPNWIKALWDKIEADGGIVPWFSKLLDKYQNDDNSFFGKIINGAKYITDFFKEKYDAFMKILKVLEPIIGKVKELTDNVKKGLNIWEDFKNWIKDICGKVMRSVKNIIKKILNAIKEALEAAWEAAKAAAKAVADGAKKAWNWLCSAVGCDGATVEVEEPKEPSPEEQFNMVMNGLKENDPELAKYMEKKDGPRPKKAKVYEPKVMSQTIESQLGLAKQSDVEFCKKYGLIYEDFLKARDAGMLEQFLKGHLSLMKLVETDGPAKDQVLTAAFPNAAKPAALAEDVSVQNPYQAARKKAESDADIEQADRDFCQKNGLSYEEYSKARQEGRLMQFLAESIRKTAETHAEAAAAVRNRAEEEKNARDRASLIQMR